MAGWLILYQLWKLNKREERGSSDDDIDVGVLIAASGIIPVIMTLGMPYFVWVAVRDNAGGRLVALWWITVGYALAGLVGLLTSLWMIPVVLLAEAVAAFLHMAIRVSRDEKRERQERAKEDARAVSFHR